MQPNKRNIYPKIQVADANGRTVGFNFSNGINGAINPTTLSSSYYQNNEIPELEGYYVVPLVVGDLNVQLLDQDEDKNFVIPSLVIENHLGLELPYKIKKIYKSLSTCTSLLVVW